MTYFYQLLGWLLVPAIYERHLEKRVAKLEKAARRRVARNKGTSYHNSNAENDLIRQTNAARFDLDELRGDV